MSYIRPVDGQAIKLADSPSIDAFDRVRVSDPFTVFDSKQLYDKGALYWDEELNGTATSSHAVSAASVTMDVAANNDYAIRQTKMRFNYQPGKLQLILCTFNMEAITANTVKRVGYFNSDTTGNYDTGFDGYYLENDGTDMKLCVAKSGTVNAVTQDNWNVDNFDGSGPSGATLDVSKAQILIIDFEWLGVGRVRMGFVIDGIVYYAHYFNHANTVGSVYCSSPNHSIRYEVRSSGGSCALEHICSAVLSEGGVDPQGKVRSYNLGGGTTDDVDIASEDKTILLGIRLKDTHLDTTVLLQDMTVMTDSGANFMWEIQLNPTISGTPSWSDVTNSCMQTFRTPTGGGSNITISADGEILASGYIAANNDAGTKILENALRLGSTLDGTRDIMTLSIQQVGTTGEDYYGSITWREL